MPGIDNPTRRVVVLTVLLILVGAALHGYVPRNDHAARTEGSGRAALFFIVAALIATTTLLAVAVIARLRDPRTVAPAAGDLSGLLGDRGGRPSWRVLLVGAAVLAAWLLIATVLAQLVAPHGSAPPTAPPVSSAPTAAPPAPGGAPSQKSPRQRDGYSGEALAVLAAASLALLVVVFAGAIVAARRRRPASGVAPHDDAWPAGAPASDSLARVAEAGLAEMTDTRREPREAIIACYAAMERELATVPGAAPQDFDTPTEVLARAFDHHALHAEDAVQAGEAFRLVNLFAEARFSPHEMNEGHRAAAVRALRLVLDGLGQAA